MYGENVIGKKVNLLEGHGFVEGYGYCYKKMTDEVCEIVSIVPWSQELNDWCQHYIVRKPDGSEVEIREVDCVFSPNKEKQTEFMVHDFLNENGVWADVYIQMEGNIVNVSIEWGDWRHQHLWARDLMSYLGYTEIGNKVTEDDGSDCFSAEHYFIKEV